MLVFIAFYVLRMYTLNDIVTVVTNDKEVIDQLSPDMYDTFINLRIMGAMIVFLDIIRLVYLCRVLDNLGQLIYLIWACLANI